MKQLIACALCCLPLAGAGLRQDHQPLKIAVRVIGRGRVPAGTAAFAERIVAAIFQKAGVAIRWVDCDVAGACQGEPGGRELRLQFLDRFPGVLSGDAVGFAVLMHEPGDPGYAAVSWPAVLRLTEDLEVEPSAALGAAMAHELGHLLLGHTHTPEGVMSPKLTRVQLVRAARGELRFEDAQAEQIRAVIRQRRE